MGWARNVFHYHESVSDKTSGAWWEIRYRCTFTKLNTNLLVPLILPRSLLLPLVTFWRTMLLERRATFKCDSFIRMDWMELRGVQRRWWMNEWIKRIFTVPFEPSVSVKWLKGRILSWKNVCTSHHYVLPFIDFLLGFRDLLILPVTVYGTVWYYSIPNNEEISSWNNYLFSVIRILLVIIYIVASL